MSLARWMNLSVIAEGVETREQLERLSLQMKEQSRKKGQKRNGVALMTMHGAKGLEFRAVFLPSLVEGSCAA